MRLDNVTVQSGNGASLVLPRACECGKSSSEPSHVTPQGPVALCSACGGRRPQAVEAPRPERQGRRKLQDFLGAFV